MLFISMNVILLLSIPFILLIIYILCCPYDKALLILIGMEILGIMIFFTSSKQYNNEDFYNPTTLPEEEKYDIYTPEKYNDTIQELKNITYNVNVNNHDNAKELETYELDHAEESIEDMIKHMLDENLTDTTVDYRAASLGAELSRRNKEAINIRSRYNKDNFKKYFEEELDESASRQWFDRDQLEYDF